MSADKESVAPVPSPAVIDTMVQIIMGQTEMTHEEVVSALERTNYDLKRVIREYMGGSSMQQASDASSTNQLRFSEIRNFMDTSDQMYYRRQEMAKIYNQVLERKKGEAAAAAEAEAKL
jgi:DNA-binding GntR family transcriptional regulator